MFNTEALQSMRERLDEHHEWPCPYHFKFIVKADAVDQVKALFGKNKITERPSRTGKYISVSADVMMENSDTVLAVYEKASKIEGIISL